MQNVFLIGAMKCGTNTLYHALRRHPHVATPKTKELDYFVSGTADQPYASHFDIAAETQITLDGTTQYSKHPTIRFMPDAIYAMNPRAKILYMMRDPIDRIESQIAHHIARGEGITADNWRESTRFQNAIRYSAYYTQISLYARLFDQERLYLGVFENFIADQSEFMRDVCSFAGVDSQLAEVRDEARNPRRGDHGAAEFQLGPEEEAELAGRLADDISCLEEVFEVDTNPWKRFQKAVSV
ncbi:MAG: sulfotransferase family protein [Boseongicola sp.]